MYLRPVHTERHIPTLCKFIKDNPLGVLTTAIKSPDHPLLQSSHIPWVLDVSEPSSPSPPTDLPPTRLRGHLARANPHAKALSAAAAAARAAQPLLPKRSVTLDEEVMILFTSPIQHYVTPKFYVATKPATGKVVPTWNYAAVQCYGRITVFDVPGAETSEFLARQIDDLSRQSEAIFGYDGQDGRPGAWSVDESPESYVNLLKKAIMGVEIEVVRLQGKWKMSQELSEGDREGVIEGFGNLRTELGTEVAGMVKERASRKDEQVKG